MMYAKQCIVYIIVEGSLDLQASQTRALVPVTNAIPVEARHIGEAIGATRW